MGRVKKVYLGPQASRHKIHSRMVYFFYLLLIRQLQTALPICSCTRSVFQTIPSLTCIQKGYSVAYTGRYILSSHKKWCHWLFSWTLSMFLYLHRIIPPFISTLLTCPRFPFPLLRRISLHARRHLCPSLLGFLLLLYTLLSSHISTFPYLFFLVS